MEEKALALAGVTGWQVPGVMLSLWPRLIKSLPWPGYGPGSGTGAAWAVRHCGV